MKYKIIQIDSASNTIILTIESTDKIEPEKEFDEIQQYLSELKKQNSDDAKFISSHLEGMIKYFEAEKAKEKRKFRRHEEISIDKQVFKELKLNIDDIINIEITKDEKI